MAKKKVSKKKKATRKTKKKRARRKPRGSYEDEFKLEVAKAIVDTGVPTRTLENELGVPYVTLRLWAKKYEAHGADAFASLSPKQVSAINSLKKMIKK